MTKPNCAAVNIWSIKPNSHST